MIGIAGSQPAAGADIAIGDTTGLMTDFSVAGGAGLGFLIKRASTVLKTELSAMEKLGITKIISNPHVFTLDNQEAVIIQGDEIPYTTTSEGGGTEISFKEAGIQLTVTPSIVGDGNIILNVVVEKKSADTSQANPPISTRQITTKLLVRDNTIVVIGGVFTQNTAETENKVPYLGDIPIVGKFFQYQSDTDKRAELLVFLAPRIL
jgi:type IV pilus assembly protein PilQ